MKHSVGCVCAAAVAGCVQGEAQDGARAPRALDEAGGDGLTPDESSDDEDVEARRDSVDGESFSRIWGTSGDLWVLGGPRPERSRSVAAVPAILVCNDDRFAGTPVVRRNRGDGWQDMQVPAETALTSLHGSGPDDVWVVGLDGTVAQFDGLDWVEHDVRAARGLEFQEEGNACAELSLHSVFARSPRDVWAVGYIYPSSLGPGLILHFDGERWERHPSGAPDGFFDVWAASDSDAWAVGASGLAYRFDGNEWSAFDAKTTQYLFSVWGTSAADVWAVGNAAATAHFDGLEWASMNPEQSQLGVISALAGSAGDGPWALLGRMNGDEARGPALARWSGSEWRPQLSAADSVNLADLWRTPEGELWGAGDEIVRLR